MITEEKCKSIIFNEVNDIQDELDVITLYIYEKKKVIIKIEEPRDSIRFQLFIQARDISFNYFLNKFQYGSK